MKDVNAFAYEVFCRMRQIMSVMGWTCIWDRGICGKAESDFILDVPGKDIGFICRRYDAASLAMQAEIESGRYSDNPKAESIGRLQFTDLTLLAIGKIFDCELRET